MKVLIIFICVVLAVLGSVEFGPCRDAQGNPKNPGDTWYESGCRQVTCGISPIGRETFMETLSCPDVKPDSPCEMVSKPYKKYPLCCPVEKCTQTAPLPPEALVWNAHGHGKK